MSTTFVKVPAAFATNAVARDRVRVPEFRQVALRTVPERLNWPLLPPAKNVMFMFELSTVVVPDSPVMEIAGLQEDRRGTELMRAIVS